MGTDRIYLLCIKINQLISEYQVISDTRTIYKVENS